MFEGYLLVVCGYSRNTFRIIWNHVGFTVGTTVGVVWGHFEGNMGVLQVVPWGHFVGNLGVTLELL